MTKKRKRGRPKINQMPPTIPDTPEAISLACLQRPPKDEWDCLKSKDAKRPADA